eukprot:5451784-Alexandrium_andersonii.AAC.1
MASGVRSLNRAARGPTSEVVPGAPEEYNSVHGVRRQRRGSPPAAEACGKQLSDPQLGDGLD